MVIFDLINIDLAIIDLLILVNYNDLTATSLESLLVREIIPFYGLHSGW